MRSPYNISKLNFDVNQVRFIYSLTQDDLANILGLTNRKTISHWESGFRNPPEIYARLFRLLIDVPFAEGDRLLYLLARQSGEKVPPRYHHQEWVNRGSKPELRGEIFKSPMPTRETSKRMSTPRRHT